MAADLFIMPFRPVYDSNQKVIPGAQAWFTLTGTNTPATIYSDTGLTTPMANPVVANAVGRFPSVYLNDAVDYRVRIYDDDATVGVDAALEEYDPYSNVFVGLDPDAPLRADLAVTNNNAKGAGLVGYSAAQTYALGTAGYELRKLSSRDLGTFAAGENIGTTIGGTGIMHAGGTSDFRNLMVIAWLNGANNMVNMSAANYQSEARHSAGTLSFQYGIQGYNRLGFAGSATGNVSTSRGVEWHIALEGSGNITDAFTFYDPGIDLADGTGLVTTFNGFRSGDHGNDRITGASYGWYQANCSAATTPITAGYGSQMSYGVKRWHFYYEGGASSWTAGRLRIGGPAPAAGAQPTDFLEVVGGIRAQTNAGTIASIGFSGAGTGGTVVQATNKATGVTLNKPCGQITMNNAALAANTSVSFTFTNDQIDADDVVTMCIGSGATAGAYVVVVDNVAGGACRVSVRNLSGGSLSEALVLNFVVTKSTNA